MLTRKPFLRRRWWRLRTSAIVQRSKTRQSLVVQSLHFWHRKPSELSAVSSSLFPFRIISWCLLQRRMRCKEAPIRASWIPDPPLLAQKDDRREAPHLTSRALVRTRVVRLKESPKSPKIEISPRRLIRISPVGVFSPMEGEIHETACWRRAPHPVSAYHSMLLEVRGHSW